MTQLALNIPPRPNPDAATARAERDAGIANAAAGAEHDAPGWGDLALEWIRSYALTHASFISEECTAASVEWGLVQPANPKSWGLPFRMAARDGIIKRDGFGVSNRRHCSPTPLWRSQLFKAAA
jgi:hypothetical protein